MKLKIGSRKVPNKTFCFKNVYRFIKLLMLACDKAHIMYSFNRGKSLSQVPIVERILWNAYCGTHIVERMLWNACCGTHIVERMLWNAYCGTHILLKPLRKRNIVKKRYVKLFIVL